jgi:pullulanase
MTHLFELKKSAFVLWNPHRIDPAPMLIIGQFQAGNPPRLANRQAFPLTQEAAYPGLWSIDAAQCGLSEGQVYHYWFEVSDSSPTRDGSRISCTDPTACTVDWRLLAPSLPAPHIADDQDPAAVVKFQNGQLVSCDPGGETFEPARAIAEGKSAPNNRMVIYELPTSWARMNIQNEPEIGVGTFRDVIALVDENAEGANFANIPALQPSRSHLRDLGINALELLPLADSFVNREWGYATSNYFAPDHDLGFPEGHSSPTPNTDLVNLVNLCHERGIRFVIDVVMAFGTRAAMENVNFPDFHIDADAEPNNPDANQSGGQGRRNNFGGKLWHYGRFAQSYDPVGGTSERFCPARQFMKAYLLRWMADFGVDGVRMDSVNNVANWDFVQEFKELARETWEKAGGAADRFIVVGEELSVPLALVTQNRLDGLWNEQFKQMLRSAILGQNSDQEPSFEWTVRKVIDCRNLGFRDGGEAINYVGSHDVEGSGNVRLFNFLQDHGVVFTEERIKLAFVCLLTAVGIPMIFAGDEFADQHDLSTAHPPKQRDAVNYERLNEPFRRRIFDYVARLVKFRTSYDALSVNDTAFIHVDFENAKRVLCWRRGQPGSDRQVVVVANFSDFITANALSGNAEYRVANWPETPRGKKWREITQGVIVPTDWVAREPIFPWEAKVYALIDA